MDNKDKPQELEDVVMGSRISFSIKDFKWVVTSVIVLVLWVVTAVLWVKDKNNQSDKIKLLEDSKTQLEKQVATLEGQIKGVENASIIFMQNPPSELKFRIDILEKRVNGLEGTNNLTTFRDTTHILKRNRN